MTHKIGRREWMAYGMIVASVHLWGNRWQPMLDIPRTSGFRPSSTMSRRCASRAKSR